MADEIKDDPFRGFLEALAKIDLNYRGVNGMKKHDFKIGDKIRLRGKSQTYTIFDLVANGEELEVQSDLDGSVRTLYYGYVEKVSSPPKTIVKVDASNWGQSRTAAIEAAKDYMDNVHAHLEVCGELNVTYERKNADYGDSFAQSLDKHGLIASIVRMDDKLNRVTSLNNSGDIQVTDESLRDTVMDLANYAIMTVMWMDSIKEEHKKIDIDEEYRLGRHPKYDIYADNLKLTGADYDGDTTNS